ncbi:MAG TPA: hypothetical protein VHA14_18000 [Bryobacteraceae bacterium]|nr:hypothetical protein [Bryobacteraceae bacterium]
MAKRQPSSEPTWKDVKDALAAFDRPGLLSLIQDLYAAQKETRLFLHARFSLGGALLAPYKRTIARWLWPDIDQQASVTNAKQAITAYRKASADIAGLADLMVFYCEFATGFASDVGYEDESYLGALVRMFEQALKTAAQLPVDRRRPLLARLDKARLLSHRIGYGVGDDLDSLFARYAKT